MAEKLRKGTNPEEHAELPGILRELRYRLRRAPDEVEVLWGLDDDKMATLERAIRLDLEIARSSRPRRVVRA